MEKSKNLLKWILIALGILLAVVLVNYAVRLSNSNNSEAQTQIPNPASTNCINLGGRLEMRTDEDGGQYGVCIKDGKECEEWSLFRGECEL